MGEEMETHGGENCADRQRWVAMSEEPAELTAPLHEESRAERRHHGRKGERKEQQILVRG